MNTESGNREPDKSQVFMVRLWSTEAAAEGEAGGQGGAEPKIEGKVTHLLSGKGSNFSDSDTLMRLLTDMLPATGNDHDPVTNRGAKS